MSLKSDFNKYITTNLSGKPINELSLIDALMDAFDKSGAYTYKYHGHKGFVQFDIKPPVGIKAQTDVVCEIADILIIMVGDKDIRYTFLQNKYSRTGGTDFLIPKVNTRQHYLLSERVDIDPLTTSLPRNILSGAICPGAGSYGDFFKNKDEYDMRYFVAKTLYPNGKITSSFYDKKKVKAFFNTYLDSKWLNSSNNVLECSHASNLDQFENMMRRMLIGSPINYENIDLTSYFSKLIYFIVKHSEKSDKNFLSHIKNVIPEYFDGGIEHIRDCINIAVVNCTNPSKAPTALDWKLGLNKPKSSSI